MTARISKAFLEQLIEDNGGVKQRTPGETIDVIQGILGNACATQGQDRRDHLFKAVTLLWSLGFSVEDANAAIKTAWREYTRITDEAHAIQQTLDPPGD